MSRNYHWFTEIGTTQLATVRHIANIHHLHQHWLAVSCWSSARTLLNESFSNAAKIRRKTSFSLHTFSRPQLKQTCATAPTQIWYCVDSIININVAKTFHRIVTEKQTYGKYHMNMDLYKT